MQETKFYCDKCGAELIPEKDLFHEVRFYEPAMEMISPSITISRRELLFCKDCYAKFEDTVMNFLE